MSLPPGVEISLLNGTFNALTKWVLCNIISSLPWSFRGMPLIIPTIIFFEKIQAIVQSNCLWIFMEVTGTK